MEISIEIRNLYRAIGELAYLLTRVDALTTKTEKIVFEEAIKEELGKESWLAKDRFERLDTQGAQIDLLATYNRAMFSMQQNKHGLNEELIEKFIAVLEKVGGVSGITDMEIDWIEKFREDIHKMI